MCGELTGLILADVRCAVIIIQAIGPVSGQPCNGEVHCQGQQAIAVRNAATNIQININTNVIHCICAEVGKVSYI